MQRSFTTSLLALALLQAHGAVALQPLSVSSDGRYLTDTQGQPVFLQGDAAWSLIAGPGLNEAENYLQDRANRGFNAVIVNLIEHQFNGPVNSAGQLPFLDSANPDFTKLNDAYFDHAEEVVAAARARGIYVLLTPAYLGYPNTEEGWYHEVNANGDAKMREYGRLVGERFKDYDNILWVAGGDRNPDEALSETLAMISGILAADPAGNLFTAHTFPEDSPATSFGDEPWYRLNNAYSYEFSYQRVLTERNTSPTRPVFLMEDRYEHEGNASNHDLRSSKWWAAASGTTGVFMGNRPIWLFDPAWENELGSSLSRDMTLLGELMRSLAWQKLQPDSDHQVVTEGYGDYGSADYATSSFATDGSLLLSYFPEESTFTVELSKFSAEVSFEWFDPTSGEIIAAGRFENLGSETFQTPGLNADSDHDWVFVGQTGGLPGDFDGNQVVDGGDFLNWQREAAPLSTAAELTLWTANYGEDDATAALSGDFDNSGLIDGSDFLLWQRNASAEPSLARRLAQWQSSYGKQSLEGATSVPEPRISLIFLMAAAWRGIHRPTSLSVRAR